MPIKNGMQVVQEVRSYIETVKSKRPGLVIKEPMWVFLTAFKTPTFEKHLGSIGVTKCYEKPLTLSTLEYILN